MNVSKCQCEPLFNDQCEQCAPIRPRLKRQRKTREFALAQSPVKPNATDPCLNSPCCTHGSCSQCSPESDNGFGLPVGQVPVPREEIASYISSLDQSSGIDRLVAHCTGDDPEVVQCMSGARSNWPSPHACGIRDCRNDLIPFRQEAGLPGFAPNDEKGQDSTSRECDMEVSSESPFKSIAIGVLSNAGSEFITPGTLSAIAPCGSGANGDSSPYSELSEDTTVRVSDKATTSCITVSQAVLLGTNTTLFIPSCLVVWSVWDRQDSVGYRRVQVTLNCDPFRGTKEVYARPVRWDTIRRYLPIIYGAASHDSVTGLGDAPLFGREVWECYDPSGYKANCNFQLVHRCYASGRKPRNLAGYQAEVPDNLRGSTAVFGCGNPTFCNPLDPAANASREVIDLTADGMEGGN